MVKTRKSINVYKVWNNLYTCIEKQIANLAVQYLGLDVNDVVWASIVSRKVKSKGKTYNYTYIKLKLKDGKLKWVNTNKVPEILRYMRELKRAERNFNRARKYLKQSFKELVEVRNALKKSLKP